MNTDQLKQLTGQAGISADQILREEAEMEILEEIAKDALSAKLVFYGGTALRLAYGSPRYSEDLDFLAIKKIGFDDFKELATKIVANRANWSLPDIKEKRNTIFALIAIKDPNLKHSFSVKIEIRKLEKKIKLQTELLLIKSQTSIAEPLLSVPTLTELQKLKIDALHDRKKARDIFDLWHIAGLLKENFVLPNQLPHYSERDFKNELQVFLPKKYYRVIFQLYAKINSKN